MKSRTALTGLLFLSLVACDGTGKTAGNEQAGLSADVAAWPAISSPIKQDTAMERRIADIVAGMTLEQKIGQMTQPDIRYITPEQARDYYIGSILNGGGAWPEMNKHATVADWAALADSYYSASMSTDMKWPVPIIWGTDAVHGHNNVVGATIFPHNIGLGAAHDPGLVEEIGKATAVAVRSTGITWAFAPTLAVVQNQRWGRTYESFSSDPELVASYARAYVRGLQGKLNGDGDVVATAKHFMGDGGTYGGVDQGENRSSLDEMIAVHGAGYYSAIQAGVQTVMASYNSWNDVGSETNHGKMHGNKFLLTDVLKGRLGFDGFVVSDWNAIEQLPGCTVDHCPDAINAGIDMIMVPVDWKAFIVNTIADVREDRINVKRIDDAVTRILRVKMRSGLFDQAPSQGQFNADETALNARDLGRRAVRQSAVLLKNNGGVLPLDREKPVLVVGKAAAEISSQSGGWTLTWQGTENTNEDFPEGTSFLQAVEAAVGQDRVVYSVDAKDVDPAEFSAVIAVLAERPYAEIAGDLRTPTTLGYSANYPEDAKILSAISGKGVPVVTVLYSGRTMYANDLLNRSDSFVAAFLPGTEIAGLTDLLFRAEEGETAYDFSGRLPFGWPGTPCSAGGQSTDKILFPVGYGLDYKESSTVDLLPMEERPEGCR